MTKQRFLVVYDYGQGGVWVSLLAASRQEVHERYPELQIVDEPPASMTSEQVRDIETRRTLDIDDDQDPFLKALREGRDPT